MILLSLLLACCPAWSADWRALPVAMPEGKLMGGQRVDAKLKVAFVGDSGTGDVSGDVFDMIVAEGADAVVHLGDFGYESSAAQFKTHLDTHLYSTTTKRDLPFFAAVGNHDMAELDEYVKILTARLPAGASCKGTRPGVLHSCSYRGLFLFFGALTMRGDDDGYALDISSRMGAAPERWKICAWHKPHHKIQAGKKSDGPGWAPYRACLAQGAFIATGHEHSYSRTHQLEAFPPVFVSTSSVIELSPGRTFTFVSGAGGRRMRVAGPSASADWQGAVYTRMTKAEREKEREKAKKRQPHRKGAGALFCSFGAGGADRAECYFKDIGGAEVDRFTLVSKL